MMNNTKKNIPLYLAIIFLSASFFSLICFISLTFIIGFNISYNYLFSLVIYALLGLSCLLSNHFLLYIGSGIGSFINIVNIIISITSNRFSFTDFLILILNIISYVSLILLTRSNKSAKRIGIIGAISQILCAPLSVVPVLNVVLENSQLYTLPIIITFTIDLTLIINSVLPSIVLLTLIINSVLPSATYSLRNYYSKSSAENNSEPLISSNSQPCTDAERQIEEIEKWNKLLDMGAITQEEFEAKKQEILGNY